MNKQWYKSKSVWTAIVTGIVGVLIAIGVNIPTEIFAFLGAAGLYSLRTAIK